MENGSTAARTLTSLRSQLPAILPGYLRDRRWFGGKARTLRAVEIVDIMAFPVDSSPAYFVLARVAYDSGIAETYDIPLIAGPPASLLPAAESSPALAITLPGSPSLAMTDGLQDSRLLTCLLAAVEQGATFPGRDGEIRGRPTEALPTLREGANHLLQPSLMRAEQSNSSVLYGNRFVLKIFRRLEPGLNPDLEIGAFLTGKTSFHNVPPLAGALEYVRPEGECMALALLQGYVANQGDAWQFTLQAVSEYYEKARQEQVPPGDELLKAGLLESSKAPPSPEVRRRIGSYLDSAALLGQRTAELHLALASDSRDPAFAPEPLTLREQRGFVDSAGQSLHANFSLLRRFRDSLAESLGREADRILAQENRIRRKFQTLTVREGSGLRIRIHGDFHLGQVLFTGHDFFIIDFEGEPARSLDERRSKRSPLQDVAGMLRSFHYAAYTPLLSDAHPLPEEGRSLRSWAQYWQGWVSAAFLRSYLTTLGASPLVPRNQEELTSLLDLYLLDKAIYELGYELNNRPTWAAIPLDGINQLLEHCP